MKKYLFHPFIFALYPVFSLYLENIDQVLIKDVLTSVVSVLVLLLIAWEIFYLALRSWPKSANLVSIFFVFLFSYGYAVFLLKILSFTKAEWKWAAIFVDNLIGMLFLLLLWGGTYALFAFLMVKSKGNPGWIVSLLNAVATLVAIFLMYEWLSLQFGDQRLVNKFINHWNNVQVEAVAPQNKPDKNTYPDIYYIILDGYARSDILAQMYQYDDSELLNTLRAAGFYIADQSKANYIQTIYSLSSSLNFSYLDTLPTSLGEDNQSLLPLRIMAENNRLFAILEQHGYYIRGIPSGYLLTENVGTDEVVTPTWFIGPFQNQLVNITPLPMVSEALNMGNLYDVHRQRILFALEHIADRLNTDQPVFTFAHILIPHPPFVIDENGNLVKHSGYFILEDGSQFIGTRQEYIDGFRNQTIYISGKIQEITKKILSQAKRPLVIVIQSDHGPGSELVWEKPEVSNLAERTSILNAYYFSDLNYKNLYPGITPVNTFRVILNQYFGMSHELLEDRSYFVSLYRPYWFQDITEAGK